MKKEKKILLYDKQCKGCELCVINCPHKLLALGENINKLGYRFVVMKDYDKCTACGICAEICPDVAIEIWRE